MRDLVDKVFNYTWEFCQQAEANIDPAALKHAIGRQMSSALTVVQPATLERIGYQRIALMINTAMRFDVTLAELVNEAVMDGVNRSATLSREVSSRKQSATRTSARPYLRLVN